MSDESTELVDDKSAASSGLSRRNALKAGAAAGVGAIVWSGVSITSLGGTPAYGLAGCTGVINLDLGGGCRNTDQGNGSDCTPTTGSGRCVALRFSPDCSPWRPRTTNGSTGPVTTADPSPRRCRRLPDSSPRQMPIGP